MIKMIATICRRPGMTHAEYLAYVQHVHGPIAAAQPVTLARYVQNHVFDSAFGSHAERTHSQVVARDSVTELYWDDPKAMADTFAHEHVRTKVGPDGANFSDLDVALSLVADEVEQPVRSPKNGAGAKVMHFLRAPEGMALPEFFARWARAHEQALSAAPAAADAMRRCVHNRQLPEFNKMLAYFGGSDIFYEGVASLWFDDPSCAGAFRAYERALLDVNSDPKRAFYQPSQSFFLYATETQIFQRSEQK
jgi:hypothetical protein